MRRANSIGLMGVVLLAAACASPPDTSGQKAPEQTGTTTAALGSSSPTLDLGSTDPTQVVTVSIIFQAKHLDKLEDLVQSTQDPRSWAFHRFLSVSDFARQFAPSAHDIARVSNYLTPFGITCGPTLADNLVLKATGTVGAFTQAFTFSVHDYQHGSQRYHRPTQPPHIPSSLSDVMLVVTGFSSQPAYVSKLTRTSTAAPAIAPTVVLPKNGTATGVPGSYTVGDFANQYDVNPLYSAGIDGTGSTIGIATLANFYPADAYTYWSTIGLTVSQSRIQQIHVDEGAGPPSANGGSGETSLDVEQSGGLAPGASIVVYDAPNTDGGFLDLFYAAASDNLVDSLSVSWGESEIFYNAALAGIDLTPELAAFHQAFLEGAAQGISIFASTGDSGAYDVTGLVPGLSNPLCVDIPAADPAITAAGGTTTPASLNFGITDSSGNPVPNLVVGQEQVWGWDYLAGYLVANNVPVPDGYASWDQLFFSTGSGGGVSTFWPSPYYQEGYPGMRRSESGQVVTFTDPTNPSATPQTLLTLPAHFEGRNIPDISADADPYTGYLVYSSTDCAASPGACQGGFIAGYGGTSFVAPQMNGVSALVKQRTGGRVGLWNPMLYRFAQGRHTGASLEDVTAGDNWFYSGVRGYEPGSGLGALDVNRFANAVAAD